MVSSSNKLKRRKSSDSIGDDESIPSTHSRKKSRLNRKKKDKTSKDKDRENDRDRNTDKSIVETTVDSSSTSQKGYTCSTVSKKNNVSNSHKNFRNKLDLILTGDKRKGLYECDYCRRDISQVPRIRCAVCPDFDLCLDCFSTTDPSAANTNRSAAQAALALNQPKSGEDASEKRAEGDKSNGSKEAVKESTKKKGGEEMKLKKGDAGFVSQHEASHGYRVADSTRFPLFPSTKSLFDKFDKDKTSNEIKSLKEKKSDAISDAKEKSKGTQDKKSSKLISNEKVSEEDKGKKSSKSASINLVENEKSTNQDANGSENLEKTKNIEKPAENNIIEKASETSTEEKTTKIDRAIRIEESNKMVKAEKNDKTEKKGNDEYVESMKNVWTVEEDLRLLDAIATMGLGNWADISEEVSGNNPTPNSNVKSAKRCMERYLDDYLGRYGHVLPPYILVEIQEKENEDDNDLDANMDKNLLNGKRKKSRRIDSNVSFGATNNGKQKRYRRISTSSLDNYDDIWPDPYIPPIDVQRGDLVRREAIVRMEKAYVNTLSNANSKEEAEKLHREWVAKHKDKEICKQSRKPVLAPRLEDIRGMKGSELAGYMPRRGDFDMEYDNDAEHILADMEFSSNDHPSERALKLQIIRIYNSKLDERERRKKFLKDWDLLDYRKNQLAEQKLPPDERDLVQRMRLFARFHDKDEHDAFLKSLLKAQLLRKQIAQLQFYRRMGITSLVEAEAYELDKRRREHHKMAVSQREAEERLAMLKDLNSSQNKSGGEGSKRLDRSRKRRTSTGDENTEKDKKQDVPETVEEDKKDEKGKEDSCTEKEDFDISEAAGIELLSKKEIGLCKRLRLLPKFYLEAKKELIQHSFEAGILNGNVREKNTLVKIDVEKRDGIIEFVMKSGWIPSKASNSNPV